MMRDDFRTLGIVLRRTNYGEADRILNIITPRGKIAAIAKGARKEKSKLAGGIEMFSLVDLNFHEGKSEFAIITGAKLVQYFNNILKDYNRMEVASSVLKKINAISENSGSLEYFDIANQCLAGINDGVDLELVQIWFCFNVARASGEEINLFRDKNGDKLDSEKKYSWDFLERCLMEDNNGEIGQDEIKTMRLVLTNKLAIVNKIKNIGELISPIFKISQGI